MRAIWKFERAAQDLPNPNKMVMYAWSNCSWIPSCFLRRWQSTIYFYFSKHRHSRSWRAVWKMWCGSQTDDANKDKYFFDRLFIFMTQIMDEYLWIYEQKDEATFCHSFASLKCEQTEKEIFILICVINMNRWTKKYLSIICVINMNGRTKKYSSFAS